METYLAREEESVPVSTSATPETFPSPLLPRRLALPDDVLTTQYAADNDIVCS